RQQDHVQNTVRQRLALLKKAAVVVEAEDLGRQAAKDAGPDPIRPAAPAATPAGTASSTAPDADGPSDTDESATLVEDEPGTVNKAQLTKLHTVLTGLGF